MIYHNNIEPVQYNNPQMANTVSFTVFLLSQKKCLHMNDPWEHKNTQTPLWPSNRKEDTASPW